MRMVLSCAAILLVSPVLARAEHPPRISPGAKVQVFAPKGTLGYTAQNEGRRSILGTVEAVTAETLTIRESGAVRTVNLRDISRLNVANGKRRNLANVLGGALAGALIVGLGMTYLALGCDCEPGDVVPVVGLSAAAGAAVGGGIGALVKTDRWERVPVPRESTAAQGAFSLSVRSVPRGATVGLTVAF